LIKCFHFVSLHPSKIAFLLLSIFYKSFPSSQSQLTKEPKVVFTPLLSTQPKPAHFLRLFHPLASRCPYNAHPTTKKERNRQPAHPSKPAACPPAQTPSSTELYYLYTIFCSYSAKVSTI